MRKIIAIAWKETLLRFSSRSELLFFLILPVIFTFILGGGFSASPGEDTSGVRVVVVDEDGGDLSRALVAGVDSAESVYVELLSRSAAEKTFEEGATGLLIIPAGFGATLLDGQPATVDLRKERGNINAEIVEQQVRAALGQVTRPLVVAERSVVAAAAARPFADDGARAAWFAATLADARTAFADQPARIVVTQPEDALTATGDGFSLAALQSAGQLVTWVFIPLLGVSGVFAYERSEGTLRRLLTTPTSRATYLLGIISGHLLAGVVQMALLIGFGVWVMGVEWGRSLPGLSVLLLAFGLAGVAFGTMLGTFVKTVSQASNVAILFGMAMALLGGCWFPLELFPKAAQTVAMLLPTRWAMEGLIDLSMRGLGAAAVLPEAGVLLLFALLFFAVGVWRYRFE